MSSKVVGPDDPSRVAPMQWRTVASESAGGLPFLAEVGATAEGGETEFERHVERRIQDAHQSGLRAGEACGRECAAAELRPIMEKLARTIDELSGLRARLRREAEGDLVRLSLSIAHRILRRELAIDTDVMHGLVLGALEKLQGQEVCRVRVHPSQAALLTTCLNQIVNGTAVEVVADASREAGALIFETERGNLDASIESQLQEIERGLVDRLRR